MPDTTELPPLAALPPVARMSTRRHISVIWVIPLIAVVIGIWLAWDTLSKEGPTIEVAFQTAEGLQVGQSQLKFKDIVFGTVKELRLSDDRKQVIVKIATIRQAAPLLTDETVFWVAKPRLFAGSLSGLDTLLSGSYVGMMPAKSGGKATRHFVGQKDPPILEADVAGRRFSLTASRLGSISRGSPVFFHDLNVGEVLGWAVSDMAESVTLHIFVRAPYDAYVHDETRFWDVSGVSIKLGSSGIDVQFESLKALLLGGVAFDTPAAARDTAVSDKRHLFPLFRDREMATAASYTRKIPAVSYFPGSIRGLAAGSDVTMHGLVVGHVTDVRLIYDPVKEAILAPVRFEIEPERIVGIPVQYHTPAEAVAEVLKLGLRASVQSASLITGQQVVALDFVKDAPEATVAMEGPDFVLPVTEGGGFAGLAASATEVLDKVNLIPFQQIGQNLSGILQGVNDTVRDPATRKALTELSATIASVQQVAGNLDRGSAPALKRLPEIAADLQKTLGNANRLVVSADTGYGDNSKFNRDLDRALIQVNDAVRSIRSLADLLAQHPEALISGRPEGGRK
jgi:paraquat-inducible protein B